MIFKLFSQTLFINPLNHQSFAALKSNFSMIMIFRCITASFTTQKMKFSIKDFFSKCDQIRKKLRIWSYLLKKFLMENFVFCSVFWLNMIMILPTFSRYIYRCCTWTRI